MRYVVLDTNALIQALPTKSPYHRIWSDFLGGKYRLCVSNEILSEYEEILSIHTSPKVAHNVVEAIAREMTPTFRAPMAEKLPPLPEPAIVPAHDCLRYMDVSMPTFTLAFLLPDTSPGDDRREIAADLAAELLCGEASPLYRRLYEQGLIDSGFSGGYECTRGKAMLVFSGDSRDPDAVCAHILNEASRLRSEGFDPSDLRRLKRSARGRRLRDLDSFSATCYRICADYFDQVDYLNFPAAFDAVTEELTADCLTWVTPVRAVRVVIAPKQEAISCSS